MARITHLGRVMVPVRDQDEQPGSTRRSSPFRSRPTSRSENGERWVEVAPPRGGAAIALVPPRGEYQPGRNTGIALVSDDPRADHADVRDKGVDVEDELVGGDGTVPLLFFFRDHDGNHLMVVESQ